MNQTERRNYLIRCLLKESEEYKTMAVPEEEESQKRLLRALWNVRMPKPAAEEFLQIQNEYLQIENAAKGILDYKSLTPIQNGLYLWQGDITRLKCDAVVNAANRQMLGCFRPNHNCIDNCIHTFAGIQLRQACFDLMQLQGHEEKTGGAKITPAYNLPARYVIHTVGPIVEGQVTRQDEELLASCYRSCLNLAAENDIHSIAFCCISTGVFMFPNKRAAEIAVETVKNFPYTRNRKIEVIFNVFKDLDLQIYRELLG